MIDDFSFACSMAAAFGSGALFSIVSGMGTPNPVANAITTGVAFAVFQGGFFMVRIWECLLLMLIASLFIKSCLVDVVSSVLEMLPVLAFCILCSTAAKFLLYKLPPTLE
jgi:hypothetical protein